MRAIQQLITKHIDIWTTADNAKKSGRGRSSANAAGVYGIKKLRELILELAVRGKLVPQDASDEPASELLKVIQTEKFRLLADGKIKKDKTFAPVTEREIPFELPRGWEWVRNGFLFSLRKGRIPKHLSEQKIGLPYLDIEALDKGIVRRYSDDNKCPQSTDCDILVVCDGSRSGLVLKGKTGIIGSTLSVIDTPIFIQPFVKLIFQQGYDRLNSTMKGAAIPHLDTKNLALEIIGLPPLIEQQRIFAKIDELMALCDQMEAQHNNTTEAHEKLVSHLLGTLTQSQSAEEFSDNWQRIAAHFDTLFTTEASIDVLKQTLLQLAVMGKLVPQDPNDEPAGALLKRIQAEKSRLTAEGKIKKNKQISTDSSDKKPFNLPIGWEWSFFPEIGELARGKSKHRPRNDPKLYKDGTIPLIQTGDVARAAGVVTTYSASYNNQGLEQSRLWPAGTMCITIAANIADSAILGFDACFPDSVVGFIPFLSDIDVRFYEFFLRTAKNHLEDFAPSTAQKNINLEILGNIFVPVLSVNEIHRIVNKVDELMAICDELKSRIIVANQLQQQLADIVAQQAAA